MKACTTDGCNLPLRARGLTPRILNPRIHHLTDAYLLDLSA